MDVPEIPFHYRLIFLVVLLSVTAAIDLARHGREASRWREYSFLLACATVGAALGASIDAVTSMISPEYFVLGKDLPSDDRFVGRVVSYGAHAGFLAGAVSASCYLLANNPSASLPQLAYRRLACRATLPLLFAALGGAIIGSSVHSLGLLRASENARFYLVWVTHAGVYFGLLVGVVVGCVSIRGERRLLR